MSRPEAEDNLRDAGGRLRGLDTYGTKAAGMNHGWIVMQRWDRFQHYSDRDPPWIKNYLSLLSDPNYGYLTHAQRSTLHGLWLLYARSQREIPDDTAWITRQLGVRVTRATLEALNHAGFIGFSASKPLATRARTRETETETETETEKTSIQGLKRTPSRARENHDDENLFADVEKLLRPWPQ